MSMVSPSLIGIAVKPVIDLENNYYSCLGAGWPRAHAVFPRRRDMKSCTMDPQSERPRPYRTSGTDTPPYKPNWPSS